MKQSDTSKVTAQGVIGGILAVDENGIQGIASSEAKRRKYNETHFALNHPESTARGHSRFTRDDRIAVLTGLEEQRCKQCGTKWTGSCPKTSDAFYSVAGGIVCSPPKTR